jgi:hypothetical protein
MRVGRDRITESGRSQTYAHSYHKGLLDRIEVGGTRRQVNQPRSGGGDKLLYPGHFVRRQIVQDDHLSRMQLRHNTCSR